MTELLTRQMELADDADKSSEPQFGEVIRELTQSIKLLRWAAVGVFAVALLAVIAAGIALPWLTAQGVRSIDKAHNPTLILIYELFRGTAYVAVVTSVLFGLLSLGRACIDQATRFQKRLVASHFLHYVLIDYDEGIKAGRIPLTEVISFLAAWSANVESAFTNVKFGSRRQKDLEFGMSPKGGITVKETEPSPPQAS